VDIEGIVECQLIEKPVPRHENYTRSLYGKPSPHIRRAVGSLILALPMAGLMIGLADKGHLPGRSIYLLSPGYVLGILASQQARSFGESLQEFGITALSVNLIYWSLILFGLFSLLARARVRATKSSTQV